MSDRAKKKNHPPKGTKPNGVFEYVVPTRDTAGVAERIDAWSDAQVWELTERKLSYFGPRHNAEFAARFRAALKALLGASQTEVPKT